MPEDIVHTETLRGYRVDIIRDGEGCQSPRLDQQNGVMLVRESRDYQQPDEAAWRAIAGTTAYYFPPTIKCHQCKGQGMTVASCVATDGNHDTCDHLACDACDGDGSREAATWAEVTDWATANYGATTVLALDARDDWGGRSYLPTSASNQLDTLDGAIFDTAERRAETGTTADQMGDALRGELTEYNAWIDGYVYGYTVTDCNGDEVGSCWGMIAPDGPQSYPLDEARAQVPDTECVKLHAVRLPLADWRRVIGVVRCVHGGETLDALARTMETQLPID